MTSILVALATVVEVGTFKAFVSYAMNSFVTTVAKGVVSDVTASRKQSLFSQRKLRAIDGRLEVVAGVMAMLVGLVTSETKIVVFTLQARDELMIRESCLCVSRW